MVSFNLLSFIALSLLSASSYVSAAPASDLVKRQSVSTLSAAAVASYKTYTHYSSAAYCSPQRTLAWNCGTACTSNSNFKPVASGGNGGTIQWWFVGYDTSLKSVIVGYQGTDASKIYPIVTDADFFLDTFSTSAFPGISSSIKGHNGFVEAHLRSSSDVLAAVKKAISANSATKVTLVGHSLGGALAAIGLLHLSHNLPSTIQLKAVTYGMPRVGNDAFVKAVDARGELNRVNYMKDIVPIVPGRFLGFSHTEGEIHVKTDGTWTNCPGTDNTNEKCTIGVVPNVFAGNLGHHSGPFDGITIGCTASLAKAGLEILPSDLPPDVPLSAMFQKTPVASA